MANAARGVRQNINSMIKKVSKMEKKIILIILFFAALPHLSADDNSQIWRPFDYLIGHWTGGGEGQPGTGGGTFDFSYDLDQNILIRRSHSEYTSQGSSVRTVHDDLLLIYLETALPEKAIYFDNEGHVIHYTVTDLSDSLISFTSGQDLKTPVFRLTYIRLGEKKVNVKFEMSRDGKKFMTYIEGKSFKTDM